MSREFHTRPDGHRGRGAAIAGVVGLLLLFSPAAPAFAHDELIGADPAPDGTVATLPETITLTFSGVLLDEGSATEVVVLDSQCTAVSVGAPVVDGTRLSQALEGAAPVDALTVQWRVVSSDGHPVAGTYVFRVGDEQAAAAIEPCVNHQGPEKNVPADVPWAVVWAVVLVLAAGVGGAALYVAIARLRARGRD